MASSFLLSLPLELRTQIYSYLFTTPKNRIELVKIAYGRASGPDTPHKILPPHEDGGEEIRLSCMRTCKQIYAETKDLLWHYNTLCLGTVLQPQREGMIDSTIVARFKHQVQSVQLDFDPTFDKTWESRQVFSHNLSILANWVTEGCLQSITLAVRSMNGSTNLTPRQLEKVLSHRKRLVPRVIYLEYLEELKGGTRESSPLSTINRRLVIDTGTPVFAATTWQPQQRQSISSHWGDPMEMLRELANAWGGRLEVNGLTAYEDGEPVEKDIFLERVDPRRFYYSDDVHLWLMTEIIKEPVDGKCIGDILLGMDRQSRAAYYRQFEPQLQALKETYSIGRIGNISKDQVEPGSLHGH